MEKKITKKTLKLEGLVCTSCETRIENKLNKTKGVLQAKVSYVTSLLNITYDETVVSLEEIVGVIEKLDYRVLKEVREDSANKLKGKGTQPTQPKAAGREENKSGGGNQYSQLAVLGVFVVGIYLIIKSTVGFSYIPEISQNMGYGILFLAGLMTSIHCVAMCGGINLSLCASYQYDKDTSGKYAKLKPNLMYNAGRVLSYTVLGGIVGAVGSVFSLSNSGKAFLSIAAGVFMVIMGLNMLNLFPALRKINPHMPKSLTRKINGAKTGKGPFVVGILNGFMPCGPLQAMQLYALGTGSMIAGALSMLLFGLGTVPFLFLFGALGSLLSTKFAKNMIKVSAVLVIALGLVMANRGLAFTGMTLPSFASVKQADNKTSAGSAGDTSNTNTSAADPNTAVVKGDVQEITTSLKGGAYTAITVQEGIPVKWTIKADEDNLTGCNRELIIPQYGIQKDLEVGDNVITFTPDKTGKFGYSCWMGMVRSSITVTEKSGAATGSGTDTSDSEETSSDTVDNSGLPASCCNPAAGN